MVLGIDISVLPLLKLVYSWSAWETVQHPSQGRQFPGQYINLGPPMFEAEILATQHVMW